MNVNQLTIEQQFKLTILEKHIQGLSQEQLQKLLLKAVQQIMIKDNIIKDYKVEPCDAPPTEVTSNLQLGLPI